MGDMRLLATLLQAFRNQKQDATLQGTDMFNRSNFSTLEDAIQDVTVKEDGSLKAGQKSLYTNYEGHLLHSRKG